MIRKIIRRTFFAGVALVCLVVVSGLVAGYLALGQPAFYAALRSQDVDAEAEDGVKQQMFAFQQWSQRSLTEQRKQKSNDADAYDPATDAHTFQITEQQLNSLLVSRQYGVMQHPRIRLEQNSVCLGAEFFVSGTKLVLSLTVKPVVAAGGRLHFEIQSGHVGRLRIPLNTLLSLMDSNVKQLSNGLELQTNGATPRLVLSQASKPRSPKVQSIACQDGQLAVTFQAPVLPDADAARGDRVSKLTGNESR